MALSRYLYKYCRRFNSQVLNYPKNAYFCGSHKVICDLHLTMAQTLQTMKSGSRHVFYFQNWLTFSKLHKPLFTEYGSVKFPNTNPPKDEDNNAYCEVR